MCAYSLDVYKIGHDGWSKMKRSLAEKRERRRRRKEKWKEERKILEEGKKQHKKREGEERDEGEEGEGRGRWHARRMKNGVFLSTLGSKQSAKLWKKLFCGKIEKNAKRAFLTLLLKQMAEEEFQEYFSPKM